MMRFFKGGYKKQINELYLILNDMQNELKITSMKLDLSERRYIDLEKMLKNICENPLQCITDIKINKMGLTVFVTVYEDSHSIEIRLYSVHYAEKNSFIRLIKYNESELYIQDFISYNENSGDGSIMMERLIQFTEERKILIVRGMLSSVDKDHFDKLEYFYKKYGFDVVFDKERHSGKIKLNLCKDVNK